MKLKDLLVTYGCNLKIDEILIADVNDLKNNDDLTFDDFHIKIQNCVDYVHNCFVWRKIEKYSSCEVLKAFLESSPNSRNILYLLLNLNEVLPSIKELISTIKVSYHEKQSKLVGLNDEFEIRVYDAHNYQLIGFIRNSVCLGSNADFLLGLKAVHYELVYNPNGQLVAVNFYVKC